MAREPPHSVTADGDKVFPQQGSKQMAREPPHSETADGDGVILTAIQLVSRGWRGSHATARQWEDNEGF
jgi:hypothetical protein